MRARDRSSRKGAETQPTRLFAEHSRDRALSRGPRLPGVGIAQWTSAGRRTALFQHRFRGVTLGARILFDLEAQVDFLANELRTSFAGVHGALTGAGVTVNAASDEVVYNFEIPGSILSGGRKRARTDPAVQTVFAARRALSAEALRLHQPPATRAATPGEVELSG
jgi:hypothetical protein